MMIIWILYIGTAKEDKDATYPVAKRKPEKIQACRESNPDLCDTGAALQILYLIS